MTDVVNVGNLDPDRIGGGHTPRAQPHRAVGRRAAPGDQRPPAPTRSPGPAAALTAEHYYRALALAVRDRMQQRWMATTQDWLDLADKVTCYLSAEFLMGPQLGNNLLNLGIEDQASEALAAMGQELDEIAGLRGGARPGQRRPGPARRLLPRLAGDPGAPVDRLRHPLRVRHLRPGDPRRLAGREDRQLAGATETLGRSTSPTPATSSTGAGTPSSTRTSPATHRVRWIPQQVIKGVSYDTPIQGYGVNTCNTLTLWSARAVESFALEAFNTGDYYKAVEDEVVAEKVTKVLYPNDEPEAGKRLRLLQQYFFVSCSLQDILRIMDELAGLPVSALPQQVGHAAQRHPPVDRGRRADAAADRRAPPGLGRGVGDHRRDLRLHQPHPAARGAGDLAAGDVRRVAAPAPGDHLRDQPPLPRRGARHDSPATRTASAGCR